MKTLEKFSIYKNDIPKGNLGWVGARWSVLLFWDFLFGFSLRRDEEGNVASKINGDYSINKKFNKIHKKCVAKLISKNPETYNTPFSLAEIEAEDFTKVFFKQWKKTIGKPLVIRNFLKGAEILEYASKQSLVENEGNKEVLIVSDTHEIKNKLGQDMSMEQKKLKDFLTNPLYEDFYVNNFYGVLDDEDFYEKCKGHELDRIEGKQNLLSQWFVSRSNKTGTSLHCAAGDNMFLNIIGEKEWLFVDPSYSSVLQTSVSKYGLFAISGLDEKIDDGHTGLLDKNPHLNHVPFYKCILQKGDLLYNPPLWWHAVKNRSDYNVGCATRYTSHSNESVAIQACMISSTFKYPTKSQLSTFVKLKLNKQNRSQILSSPYSGKKEK